MNYKEIVQNVLRNGVPKQPTRMENGVAVKVENGTIGTFCEIFRHDMAQGFPLSTLRKLPFRSICVELEGFIKGITDKQWFQDRKCKFWSEWSNPQEVDKCMFPGQTKSRKQIQEELDDLGPIYGYQWRKFGEWYDDGNGYDYTESYQKVGINFNGIESGFDQLKSIVEKLKSNPYDRRMVCSAWNPNQMHLMALPPCHLLWNVTVYGDKLNLCWHQRSCDLALGVPANIASYAMLLLLLCEESGLTPGELVGNLVDCHLYENQIEAAKALIERDENPLPEIAIKYKAPDNYTLSPSFSIFDWEYTDVELVGYNPHPPIDMGSVTV
jgi:thymidylate synthase